MVVGDGDATSAIANGTVESVRTAISGARDLIDRPIRTLVGAPIAICVATRRIKEGGGRISAAVTPIVGYLCRMVPDALGSGNASLVHRSLGGVSGEGRVSIDRGLGDA